MQELKQSIADNIYIHKVWKIWPSPKSIHAIILQVSLNSLNLDKDNNDS